MTSSKEAKAIHGRRGFTSEQKRKTLTVKTYNLFGFLFTASIHFVDQDNENILRSKPWRGEKNVSEDDLDITWLMIMILWIGKMGFMRASRPVRAWVRECVRAFDWMCEWVGGCVFVLETGMHPSGGEASHLRATSFWIVSKSYHGAHTGMNQFWYLHFVTIWRLQTT